MIENKLIAEFMGFETYKANSYSMVRYSEDNERTLQDTHYHTSWDWLMPVVSKCRCDSDSEDSHWEEIYYTLEECNLNTTYKAVVEFINEYNQNK